MEPTAPSMLAQGGLEDVVNDHRSASRHPYRLTMYIEAQLPELLIQSIDTRIDCLEYFWLVDGLARSLRWPNWGIWTPNNLGHDWGGGGGGLLPVHKIDR
ncbi:unnamed protein product [Somion occarium]|uniref:Uncharacterized protein n=1 Tax=Somion occarium TaxID=3059160 RepID=A0ABP1DRB4_9APHY